MTMVCLELRPAATHLGRWSQVGQTRLHKQSKVLKQLF